MTAIVHLPFVAPGAIVSVAVMVLPSPLAVNSSAVTPALPVTVNLSAELKPVPDSVAEIVPAAAPAAGAVPEVGEILERVVPARGLWHKFGTLAASKRHRVTRLRATKFLCLKVADRAG